MDKLRAGCIRARYDGSVCAICGLGIAVDEMITWLAETSQYCHERCLSRPPDRDDAEAEGSWHD